VADRAKKRKPRATKLSRSAAPVARISPEFLRQIVVDLDRREANNQRLSGVKKPSREDTDGPGQTR
jgi:hypothetical protein